MTNDKENKQKWYDAKHITAYVAMATACISLFASYTSYLKSKEEKVARDSYKTVSLAIERLSDESQLNHADVVSLRQYLVDHVEGTRSMGSAAPAPAPPPVAQRSAPVVVTKTAKRQPVPDAGVPNLIIVGSAVAVKHQPQPPASMPDEWPSE